ncbi:MAG: hypothetical protein ACK5LO_08805 [Leucobacter sp.]
MITCAASSTCRGSLKVSLSTGGAKTLKYSVSKRGTKTLRWTLSTANYKKLVNKGSATLRIEGAVTAPSKAKFSKKVTLKAAKPRLAVVSTSHEVDADRRVGMSVRCKSAAGCVANIELLVDGASAAKKAVKTSGKGDTTVTFKLSQASYATVTSEPSKQKVVIRESQPDRVQASKTITLSRAVVEPPTRGTSKAYTERNWTPTEYDTCPASLHEQYRTVGPDGKYYPTWHPAQVTDPATGQLCTFGHEHGADPSTSDIYDWVADLYAPADLVSGEPKGLPFGYTSEEVDNHIHEHGGMSMRHEDNPGHKVFLANDVKMLDADRNWLRLADGTRLECDFLIKLHQGSWSPDATSNNAHESLFAAKCNDGTELITSMLTRFGNANEMHGTCAPSTPIPTVGSTLPAGDGGKRIIPTHDCVKNNPTDWTLYEVWQSDSRIVAADGTDLAYFDPWFGVRNPSRMYQASTATTNAISRPLDLAWLEEGAATNYLWTGLSAQDRFDYADPRSPFNGAQRDFYLGDLQLTDPGTASGIVYSNPYGASAGEARSGGSIAQLIRPGSVLGTVQLTQQKFDSKADYGKNNGVHAPN